MNMDHFYNLGINAAITKLAAAPSPAMTGLAKRLLLGGGVGAAGGALIGGEGNRGTGALLGGALGAGGLAGIGRLANKGLRSSAASNIKLTRELAREAGMSPTVAGRQVQQAWKPALQTAESRIIPRLRPEELQTLQSDIAGRMAKLT